MAGDNWTLQDFRNLLDLQKQDSSVTELEWRRGHLPAHAAIAGIEAQAAELRPRLAAVAASVEEFKAGQMSLESQVEAVEHRIAEINKRLYDPTAKIAPADTLAMTHEIKHLQERRSHLEDDELGSMEASEPVGVELVKLQRAARELSVEMENVLSGIKKEQASIDSQLAALRTQRDATAANVPSDLLDVYEKLKKTVEAPSVVEVTGRSCGGCHLTLSASELDRIRKAPDNEIVRCEECGRLLVR